MLLALCIIVAVYAWYANIRDMKRVLRNEDEIFNINTEEEYHIFLM